MYSWRCTECAAKTEIVRSVADYEMPPTEEDGKGLVYCEVDEKHGAIPHKWERYIPEGSGNFHLVGRGWAKTGYNKW